jgi:hypothetical protein
MVNERVGAGNWENSTELGDTWAARNAFSYGEICMHGGPAGLFVHWVHVVTEGGLFVRWVHVVTEGGGWSCNWGRQWLRVLH